MGRATAETVRAVPFGRWGSQSGQYSFQRPVEVTTTNRLGKQLGGVGPPAYFHPENMNWAQLQRFRRSQVAEARPAQNAAGREVHPRRGLDQQKQLPVNGANADKGVLQLRVNPSRWSVEKARRSCNVSECTLKENRKEKKQAWANSLRGGSCAAIFASRWLRIKFGKRKMRS